ncbi:TLC domain-containing protein [Phaeosphaeria sp. MPI-PUGE-AT-0046c]|nr:TLC domain-containing protein [Phaeosphaeria sp. MPI-PUGE-AT-0046c]
MLQSSYLITNLDIVPKVFLGPEYLNLPGLPTHLPLVILSAIFYQCVYSFVAPLLWSVFEDTDPNSSPGETIRSVYYFNNIVSVTQSFINSVLAVYLLSHPEFRDGLNPSEMALGYQKETARVLAVSMGYFVYHLIETWMHIGRHGINMVLHAVCALFAVSLGYRPLALHYTGTFLIWELPNLFLNFQRLLDHSGRRNSWYRAVNRIVLLSTYAVFRLGLGSFSLLRMSHQFFLTATDPHPMLRAECVVPSLLVNSEAKAQQVSRLPILLAIFQLTSMTVVHIQGFVWFTKIVLKGDLRKKYE